MYKVTLYDKNIGSCCSGTFSVFCEDIDKFEKEWIMLNPNKNQIKRFRRSKAGEIVTDYYSDNPELNIVQQDKDDKVLFEKKLKRKGRKAVVHNGYNWPMDVYFDHAIFDIKYIYFQGTYMRLVRYKLCGVYIGNSLFENRFDTVPCWGNEILKSSIHTEDGMNPNAYANDTVESIAYYPMGTAESEEELKRLFDEDDRKFPNKRQLDRLLRDIPGEAG